MDSPDLDPPTESGWPDEISVEEDEISLAELRRQQGVPAGLSLEEMRGPGMEEAEFRAFFNAAMGHRRSPDPQA